jgi:hypothetical protein
LQTAADDSSSDKRGDIAVSNNAYFAMIDTLIGLDESLKPLKNRSFSGDFKTLCSPSVSNDVNISSGCAMIAVEVYGGEDRSISEYYYQVERSNLNFSKINIK